MTAVHQSAFDFRARPLVSLLVLLLPACAAVVTTTVPQDVGTIVVLPVDNRTGSPLYADAPPLVAALRDAPEAQRVSAADLLTDELRDELSRRGFRVVRPEPAVAANAARTVDSAELAAKWASSAGVTAPVLYVSLERWDATAMSHVLYVDVEVDATLVAPDGRVLWTSHLPARPVDGGGASSVSLAYPAVARRVAELVLANLRPQHAAS